MGGTKWYEILGWVGVVSYLTAYLFLSAGKLRATAYSFQGLNALGALGLIVNSLYTNDLPSVVVNTAWLIIATVTMLRIALWGGKD